MNQIYTVGELSKLTGVTIKTLHFYQKIGLLSPHHTGKNGYRYYSEQEVNRLQDILIYRNMGFRLDDIKQLLNAKENKQRIHTLKHQQEYAKAQLLRYSNMLDLINESLEVEQKGAQLMNQKEKIASLVEYEDSLPRTLQNITVLLAKPFLLPFFFISIYVIVRAAFYLINGNYPWHDATQAIIINFAFIGYGLVGLISSGYMVFIRKTRFMLEAVNAPYKKQPHTSSNENL